MHNSDKRNDNTSSRGVVVEETMAAVVIEVEGDKARVGVC
jgi:hypothetical protein